jgi:hypothetical protein
MAELLRRIFWLIPVLVVGAVASFFVFGSLSSVQRHFRKPLFYNSAPQSAETSAKWALELVKKGDPQGAEHLATLGGAALPIVLQELPALTIHQQRAVGRALAPVARRMQIQDKSAVGTDSTDADAALLFWQRYGEEHSLDLRPLTTTRLVKRTALRDSQVRNADLLAVDTYALPTLVGALGRISDENDIVRTRRLVTVISHVTEQPWEIPRGASIEQARKVATEIRRFFDENGAKWTDLQRFELLVARFSQTEFANWVFRSVRQVTGLDHPELLERLAARAAASAPRLAFCLIGFLVFGPMVAAVIQVLQLRRSRFQLERFGLRAVLAGAIMTLLLLAGNPKRPDFGYLALLALLIGTAISTFILQRELGDRLDWRTHHVLRSRPGREKVAAVARWLAPSIPTLTPLAVAEAAVWITCLEVSAQADGLFGYALSSIREGDLDYLVTLCLGLGLITGTAQALADLVLGTARSTRGEVQ